MFACCDLAAYIKSRFEFPLNGHSCCLLDIPTGFALEVAVEELEYRDGWCY